MTIFDVHAVESLTVKRFLTRVSAYNMHTNIQVTKYVKTLRDQSAAQKVKDKQWGGVFQRGEIYDPETIAAEAAAAAAAKVLVVQLPVLCS